LIAARADIGSIVTSIRVGPLIAVSVVGAVILIVAIWRPLTAMPRAQIAATAAETSLIASSPWYQWPLQ
jgi:hypothetical protein